MMNWRAWKKLTKLQMAMPQLRSQLLALKDYLLWFAASCPAARHDSFQNFRVEFPGPSSDVAVFDPLLEE